MTRYQEPVGSSRTVAAICMPPSASATVCARGSVLNAATAIWKLPAAGGALGTAPPTAWVDAPAIGAAPDGRGVDARREGSDTTGSAPASPLPPPPFGDAGDAALAAEA